MCMLCAVIACNRESEEYHNDTGSSLTEEQALSAFAQTLSKAVFESEEIRVCLKNEALKQIDNDYDVFYPDVTYRFFEVDSGDESHESETISFKYVINLNQTFDTSNDNHKTQLGLSGNCEYQDTQSISLKWKQENERLGDVVVDYNTPYILGKDSNNKYQLNPLSSNNIIINILPYYEVK